MTRINVVPPQELCDQHLLAEHRELTRIPNRVLSGKFSLEGQPSEYVLGKGHVKFFYDKVNYLWKRYMLLHNECWKRGFKPSLKWPKTANDLPNCYWQDYTPTPEALELNRQRITERMPAKPRFSSYIR